MIQFKRGADITKYQNGEWFHLGNGVDEVNGHKNDVVVCCPKHGELVGIYKHTIDAKGVVAPSVVCPKDGCLFHEYITLEGWDEALL